MLDCEGIDEVDPEEDGTGFCEWVVSVLASGCADDCEGEEADIVSEIIWACEDCLPAGNCDDIWGDDDIADGCDLPDFNLYLTDSGEVLYNSSSSDIGGFQFNVDGATVLGASAGDAEEAGFTVSSGGSTVLGYSFTGSFITA